MRKEQGLHLNLAHISGQGHSRQNRPVFVFGLKHTNASDRFFELSRRMALLKRCISKFSGMNHGNGHCFFGYGVSA